MKSFAATAMRYYFYILFYANLICILNACSCINYSPQNAFCENDFVMKAQVVHSPSTKSNSNNFTVTTLEFYMRSPATKNVYGDSGNFVFNILDLKGTSCSMHLTDGATYVLSGYIENGKANVSECNWKSKWDSLSNERKEALAKGTYLNDCDTNTRQKYV